MPTHTHRPTRCTSLTAAGDPCKAWAARGTDPPTCAIHAGLTVGAGAPIGNQNRRTHGFYSTNPAAVNVDQIIAGLVNKLHRLDQLIDQNQTVQDLTSLISLYAQATSRLSRLLRDRRALSGEAASGVIDAIAAALDELGTIWGLDL